MLSITFLHHSTYTLTIKDNDFIVPNWMSIMIELIKLSNVIKNNICISVVTVVAIISVIIFLYFTALTSYASFLLISTFSNDKSSIYAFAKTTPEVGEANAALSLSDLINQGSPYQGSKLAPVVLIDFSDLQCKLCQRFVKSAEPQINSTYIQTGKVALIFKHLPNRGFDSTPAALAAQCTSEQGKFWQFHNLLYKIQGPIDSGWASKDNLKKLALQIPRLDIQKFNSCFDSQKYKSFIESNLALAHSLGFTQTPSFIIEKNDGSNPQKLEGPQPFPEFKFIIDKELG
jgi:protein-disulfide isomerase